MIGQVDLGPQKQLISVYKVLYMKADNACLHCALLSSRGDTHQDYDRSARLCCVGPGHMEQPSCRTADFITVFSFAKNTQKSFIRLLAPLKTFWPTVRAPLVSNVVWRRRRRLSVRL